MQKKENELLADMLAAIGGGIVTRWMVARVYSNDIYEVSMNVAVQPPRYSSDDLPDNIKNILIDGDLQIAFVLDIVRDILDEEGALLVDGVLEEEETSGLFEVNGLTRAGFLDLNPTIIRVSIKVTSYDHMHIIIKGKAKEGIIKQHAGEKAAQRIAQRLSDELKAFKIFLVNGENAV